MNRTNVHKSTLFLLSSRTGIVQVDRIVAEHLAGKRATGALSEGWGQVGPSPPSRHAAKTSGTIVLATQVPLGHL